MLDFEGSQVGPTHPRVIEPQVCLSALAQNNQNLYNRFLPYIFSYFACSVLVRNSHNRFQQISCLAFFSFFAHSAFVQSGKWSWLAPVRFFAWHFLIFCLFSFGTKWKIIVISTQQIFLPHILSSLKALNRFSNQQIYSNPILLPQPNVSAKPEFKKAYIPCQWSKVTPILLVLSSSGSDVTSDMCLPTQALQLCSTL